MTIEHLTKMQDLRRGDATRMPVSPGSVDQESLSRLTEIVVVLTEICIELKQWRMHE